MVKKVTQEKLVLLASMDQLALQASSVDLDILVKLALLAQPATLALMEVKDKEV